MPAIRTSEVLAAVSLTGDLTSGLPFEEGLAICLVASAFATELGLTDDERESVYYAGLLRAVGCTAHASENAALFGNDVAFQAALRVLDPGDPEVFGRQLHAFGNWDAPRAAEYADLFVRLAATEGPAAARNGCEVSRALGPRLGLPAAAVAALDDVHERWDGLGIPTGRSGPQLTLAGRVVHVAEQAVRAASDGGLPAACAEVARRSGGHLDPDLAAAFARSAEPMLAPLAAPDRVAAVVAAEPHPRTAELTDLAHALAMMVDLKGRYLLGHSAHVATLAGSAAELAGLDADLVRSAALMHDIGRAAVPSSVWDRGTPLTGGEWEQARLHPYWTERVLLRCPSLARFAALAGAHHERLDGSGYHRGARAAELPAEARLLAAADAFAELTEDRPDRPRRDPSAAANELAAAAAAGGLDRDSCAAVIEAAGLPRPRLGWPAGLTDREVDVLRLAARGLSNRELATRLSLSERTVAHHLAHIYDKTGRRTRAGAAVFAMEHGLIPE